MSFKYINPGYSKLISDKEKSYLSDFTPNSKQSRTGRAFYNYNDSYIVSPVNKFTRLLPVDSGTEFWAKSDFYFSESNVSITFKQNRGSGLYFYLSDNYWLCYTGTKYTKFSYNTLNEFLNDMSLRKDEINTIWLHVLLSANSSIGYVEFKINNKYFGKYFGDTMPGGLTDSAAYLYEYFLIRATSSRAYFSNVIISDEEISPYERVVPLTALNTVTDMDSLPSGLYTADIAGKKIFQSVDISDIANEYGTDSKVTGIALIGNPAYEVDDVVGSLTSLTKEKDAEVEHDTFTLSTDSDAMILSSFSVPTDTTVADLADMQFGWRSEE